MRLVRLALYLPLALIAPALFVSTFSVPSAQAAEIEEIIVTARKREENLQDVPLSITAFSAREIERAAFADLEDISLSTPGLQMNSELSGTRPGRLFSNMRFRGVTGAQFAALQTASLFIDGIYVLQAAQSLALTDLERVEIIKGPQSAVFGRNSFAGAVNYVTRTPNLEEFQSSVLLDIAQHDQYEASLSFEGPIVEDKLAFRVGVRSYNKGGMYTASDGGALGEQSSNSIFATLYGEPTKNFTFRFRAYYQEDDDGPSAVGLYRDNDFVAGNDTCTGTSYMGFDGDDNFTELFPSDYLCGEIPDPGVSGAGNGTAPPIDSNTSLRPNFHAFAPPNNNFLIDNLLNAGRVPGVPRMNSFGIKREITRVSLMGEYTFNNDISLTGTLAYNENVAGNIRDFDLTPVESWWVTNPQAGEDKSADIRVASAQDKRLRWMVGVNYYEQEWLTSDNAGVLAHSCANFAAFGAPAQCDFPGIFPVGLDGGDTVEQASVYVNLSFDITDKWTIDLEGRYQEDTRGDGVSPTTVTYKSVIPRVTLSFKPTENIMMYALATEGVLPGVFNSNFANCGTIPDVNVPTVQYTVPFTDPNTGQPSTSSVCDQYREQVGVAVAEFTEQQVLEAFEIGFRTSWADGRILANVSIYTQEWKEQPSTRGVTAFLDNNNYPGSGVAGEVAADGVPNLNPNFFSVVVAGSSKYSGVELETVFVPTDDWTINFNLSYNDNEFLNFFTGTGGGAGSRCGTTNLRGKRNTRFPKWSGNLSSTYTWEMSGDWSTYVRGDVSYTGETHPDSCNLATSQDYYLVNGRVGMEKDDIRVELYVKNLMDEETWRAASNFGDFSFRGNGFNPLAGAGIVLIPQDKRTVGIRVFYDF
jgi:iron complex outermembrane receptor protein